MMLPPDETRVSVVMQAAEQANRPGTTIRSMATSVVCATRPPVAFGPSVPADAVGGVVRQARLGDDAGAGAGAAWRGWVSPTLAGMIGLSWMRVALASAAGSTGSRVQAKA